jgi:hypothetical protein
MKLKRRKAYRKKKDWPKGDEKLLLNYLKQKGFNADDLLELFPKRSLASIRSKVRKLRIKHDIFGNTYRDEKITFTEFIALTTYPKIVFDAYAGAGHQTFIWARTARIVYASEVSKGKLLHFKREAKSNGFIQADDKDGPWRVFKKGEKRVYYYTGDAVSAAADLKTKGIKTDLVDLDTCGSTLPTLSYFLLMLKPKHLVITHGEFHSMRFKREDVLRRLFLHRDVNVSPLPIGVDEMADELDKAVKISALRTHNETIHSYWPELIEETWLGGKFHGMLRRYYKLKKPAATSDCLNIIAQ